MRLVIVLACLAAIACTDESGPPPLTAAEPKPRLCATPRYCLTKAVGPPGMRVRATAPLWGRSEGGRLRVKTTRFELWWDVNPRQWTDHVAFADEPRETEPLARVSRPIRRALHAYFRVPDVSPGVYPIVGIQYGGGGAAPLVYRFRVTESAR